MAISTQAIVKALLKCLRLLTGIWVLAWTSSIPAADNLSPPPAHPQFAGWLDTSGTADLSTVQERADWENFSGWKSWAYGKEPIWLKVEIPPISHAGPEPYTLIIRPSYLDSVTLYDPDTGSVQRSGDFYWPSGDALGSLLFTFEVPAQDSYRSVFIKLQSTGSRVVHLSLMQHSAAMTHIRKVEWATGSVLLISVFLFAWSFGQWLQTRDRLIGYYATKQLMSVLWGFMYSGFAWITISSWFPEGVFSLISGLVLCAAVASVLWFYAALLQEYKAPSWALFVLRLAVLISLFLSVTMVAGLRQESLQLITLLFTVGIFIIPISLLCAGKDIVDPPVPRSLLLIYVSFYCGLNTIAPLVYLGLLDASPVNHVFLYVGNMASIVTDGLIMFMILHIRQKRFAIRHQKLENEFLIQKEQSRLNQQFLDEQRKLMEMLAHEVKTPLTNIRLWMEAGQKGKPIMERAIYDLSSVIERCVHAQQLSSPGLLPDKEWFDVIELAKSTLASSRHPERVNLHLTHDILEISSDAQMISVILSNLLENAYKYSAPATSIDLWLKAALGAQGLMGWSLVLENVVASECVPDRERLFERYYRAPYAMKKSGSGLGLYIVKSLVELMQGQVSYTPLPGRVRFEVWLPLDYLDANHR